MKPPIEMALPAPTRDLGQAKRDIEETGCCLIAEALDPEMLKRARDAFYRAADNDLARGRVVRGFGLDLNDGNQRVWNLLSRDPVFADLAEHPIAIDLVTHVIGWPALLSNISGNLTAPGAAEGVLHADQIFVPEPWPAEPQGINVAWCLDDCTAENGATRVLVGSHRLNRGPTEEEEDVEMTPVEAPAGSIFAFESRIWHRTGANTSNNSRRAVVFPFYSRTIYRPQENWFLSLDPSVRMFASDTLLTLLAFKSEGFGLVYGQSPQ